jgi:Cupredoxin-like domain
MHGMRTHLRRTIHLLLLASSGLAMYAVPDEKPVFQLEIRNHLYEPAEFTIPANTRIRLQVTNQDPTPEEFESYELNREKVIMGNRSGLIFIGPLAPGEYPFFGEFHPKTAQGRLIAR